MKPYNSLNVKLSNSQINKSKSAIKNETELVLKLSSNMISDNETNFLHQLLLTNTQFSHLKILQIIHQLILSCQRPRRISLSITRSITKNRITINKKCN